MVIFLVFELQLLTRQEVMLVGFLPFARRWSLDIDDSCSRDRGVWQIVH